jgi:acyl-CoA reductase-like NAD-dependent aldehyde dehydrogenase
VYDGFEQMLASEASRVVVGDPMDTRTELGPLVNAEAAQRVEREVQEGVSAGGRLVCGGRRDGAVFPPTLLADVNAGNPIFREAAFGPVISLIRAADEDDSVALANDSHYALRAAVFGRDVQRAAAVARRLDCSGVAVNGPSLVDNPRLNVEPRKMSGIGAEGIEASLLEYSQPKFIWINDWWPEAS